MIDLVRRLYFYVGFTDAIHLHDMKLKLILNNLPFVILIDRKEFKGALTHHSSFTFATSTQEYRGSFFFSHKTGLFPMAVCRKSVFVKIGKASQSQKPLLCVCMRSCLFHKSEVEI